MEEQLCAIQHRGGGGGQQEEKRRGSRWRGQGGGGDVCQEGWLGSTLGGTDGIKALSGIRLFVFSLCFLISRFCTTSAVTRPFFSFPALLPVHALIISPLHRSLSLFCTSFHSCPCAFERPLTAAVPSWEMSLAGDARQHGSDDASLPGEGVKHGQRHHTDPTAGTRLSHSLSLLEEEKQVQGGRKLTLRLVCEVDYSEDRCSKQRSPEPIPECGHPAGFCVLLGWKPSL